MSLNLLHLIFGWLLGRLIPLGRASSSKTLSCHYVPTAFVPAEHAAMAETRLARTADRSLVGILNEFARLADWHRTDNDDLLDLSLRLATKPVLGATTATSAQTENPPP